MHIITIIHSNHNYGWWSGSLEAELWTRPLQDVSGSSTRTSSDHRRQRWRFRPSPGDLLPTSAPEGQRHTRPRPQITGLASWAETSVLFLRCPRNRNKFPSCTERNVERPGSPLPLPHSRRRAGCLEEGGGQGAGWSGISPAGFWHFSRLMALMSDFSRRPEPPVEQRRGSKVKRKFIHFACCSCRWLLLVQAGLPG